MVILTWRDGRTEVEETPEPEESIEWVFRLAEDDSRLARAIFVEECALEDDADWGGPSLFVRNVVCFHGHNSYPPYWYQEATPKGEVVEPPKKAKKK